MEIRYGIDDIRAFMIVQTEPVFIQIMYIPTHKCITAPYFHRPIAYNAYEGIQLDIM